MFRKKLPHTAAAQGGFALVITLTLMILLTILALGLLGLSSVALRTSSQGDSQAEARANARMALMMAIAELQKELGPDSRISAPSDAGTMATGGQPRWTAVYDAWKWNADSSTPQTPQSRAPKFRGWLVSGANAANGGPVGTGTIPLVGSKSLSASGQPMDQIKAPMLPVSRGNRKGMIAWWSSDESTKAKINAGGDATVASNPLSESQSPRYIGHKSIDALKNLDWKPGQRSAAVSTGGVNLAAGFGTGGLGRLSHDVTVHSNGVIADVRGGHLKRDLSNLLSRPIAEQQNKPLYVADGRMNRFLISGDGSLTNDSWVVANAAGAGRWGINLEELHLFHQIHREVDWSSGKPQLVNKNTTQEMINDPFFLYRKPKVEAVNVMLSFVAEPDTAPNTYRLAGMIDAMVATSNPNDIPIVWPASVLYRMEMVGFPYRPQWTIRRADNTVRHGHTATAINRPFLQSAIRNGFTLEPGEAAVFGSSTTDTSSRGINLTRGYVPRGGIRISEVEWGPSSNPANDGLRATGLLTTDTVDFNMVPAPFSNGNTSSGWISCLGEIRNTSGGSDFSTDTLRLSGGGNTQLNSAQISKFLPSSIRPPQRLAVSDFIGKPMPVLMVTVMPNVERSRTNLLPPNAFASRPYHFHEPAVNTLVVSTNPVTDVNLRMQERQLVVIGESMDYAFGGDRTMPAGVGGRNLYHGGAREAALGGSLNVIKRRIPLASPLSLGTFENAVACGFVARLSGGTAFSGAANGIPATAKAIGNSWSNPFLTSDLVYTGAYHDPSWMVNTALWDSWFLSGVVFAGSSAAWNSDPRSQKLQFQELAAGTGSLRNGRFFYHPHKSTEDAITELFDGELLRPSAITKLTKYLLIDGAFNVNSTSLAAWKAFLTSVKDQQILDANGAAQKKTHPFGTMGYAVSAATSGTEGDWSGFRDLTDVQMDALAAAIVVEVKARGPFLNMADFVNRRPNSTDATHKSVGALQAVIDKSGINDRYKVAGRELVSADISMLAGKDTPTSESTAARAIGAAGFLSQGALLTAFGSQITVRGDTFLVRTYGDSRDTAGNVQAKAWCEAVVQRTPEFVDPTNPPETSDSLTPANAQFGRKFNIVSFRWLSPDEI